MIVDKADSYWVDIEGRHTLPNVQYCPEDDEEYKKFWGKWLIWGSPIMLKELGQRLDLYVDKGEIDSAKYNREPSRVGRGKCVMCVYADYRDRDRVWAILNEKLGITQHIWKFDEQTYRDWEPGGRLDKLDRGV